MGSLCFSRVPHRTFSTPRLWCVWGWLVAMWLSAGCAGTLRPAAISGGGEPPSPFARVAFDQQDSAAAKEIETCLARGKLLIEAYFEMPFSEGVSVRVCPTRQAFTASFPPEWGMTETECWMVATGVASTLNILSPRVWREQACEHDARDSQHVQDIVVHELVHVFHGQHNPTRDFTGAEEVGWFAEGLAVHVSGQLDHGHLAEPGEAIERGAAPARLADAWSGKYRYGVCGSLVAYMDAAYGRARIRDMLAVTTQADLLALAGVTESKLLDDWKKSVVAKDRH